MRVQVPPKTAPYDNGMSSFLGLTPARRDQAMMILQAGCEWQHHPRKYDVLCGCT